MADSDVRLQRFADFLARAGRKSTRQRERIVHAFFDAGRHLSAEELYHRIRTEDPRIGLVTVYRTLKLLQEAGLATGRQFGADYRRFDPNAADRPHDHLVCIRCGRIQEFADVNLQALRDRVARSHGFIVTESRLELYGFCRECARRSRARGARDGKAPRAA